MISKPGLADVKPFITPIDTNSKVTIKEYDKCKRDNYDPKEDHLTDHNVYQRLIGNFYTCVMTL